MVSRFGVIVFLGLRDFDGPDSADESGPVHDPILATFEFDLIVNDQWRFSIRDLDDHDLLILPPFDIVFEAVVICCLFSAHKKAVSTFEDFQFCEFSFLYSFSLFACTTSFSFERQDNHDDIFTAQKRRQYLISTTS